jgi:hypothetical protein
MAKLPSSRRPLPAARTPEHVLRAAVALGALVATLGAAPAAPAAVQGASLSTFDGPGFGSRLEADPRGTAPTATSTVSRFASTWNRGDRYGTRIRARVTAPSSGRYQFSISGGDEAILLFSDDPADTTGASARTIAWTPRATTEGRYAVSAQRSARFTLAAGRSYYLEAWQTAGTGSGDGVTARWSGPGFGTRDIPASAMTPASGGCTTWCPPLQQPSVSGVPQVGVQLTAQPGGYLGGASGVSYAWIRCNAAASSCTYIRRAAAATYTPVARDVGSKLSVRVARPGAGSWLVLFAPLTTPVLAAVPPAGPPPAAPPPSTPSVPAPVSSPAAGTAPAGEVAIDPGVVLAVPEDAVATSVDSTPPAADPPVEDAPAPEPAPPAFVADTTPPASPVLSADTPTNASPALTWGAVADATSYAILRDGVQVGTTTATAYVDGVGADGTYVYAVAATDAAGNTGVPSASVAVTRDTVAPDTAIVDAPADSSTGLVTVAFTSDDPAARFECRLDHADFAGCESPLELAGVADGSHTIAVRAVDAAENADPTPARATFTVDTTPPAAPEPTAASPTRDQPALAWPAVPDAASYAVLRDGERVGTTTGTTFADSGVGDGTYGYVVVASDALGNVGDASVPVVVTVDTTAPAAPTPSAPSPARGAALTWPAVVGAVAYRVERDGATVTTTAATAYADAPADGPHDYSVTAIDAAGNESAPAGVDVVVDSTPPAVPGGLDAASPTSGAPRLAWTAVPGAVDYVVSRDGAEIGRTRDAAFTDDATLAEGAHAYAVAAIDAAGNVSAPTSALAVTVDVTPPAAPTLTATADTSVPLGAGTGAVILQVGASADTARVVLRRGATVVLDGTPRDLTDAGLADDARYTYTLTAFDAAGNASATTSATATTPDRTAPSIAAAPTGSGYPLVVRVDPNPGTTFTLRRDGADVASGREPAFTDVDATDHAAPDAPTALAASDVGRTGFALRFAAADDNGTRYAYDVRGADDAGNEGAPSPLAHLTAVSGTSGYRVLVNGAKVAETTDTTVQVDGLTAGVAWHVAVVAVDDAGNASPASETYVVGSDEVPTVPADLTAAASPTNGAPALRWQGVEHAVRYLVLRDGVRVATVAGTTYVDAGVDRDGTFAYTVEAVGNAGEPSAPSAPLEVVVDRTPPVTRLDAAPHGTVRADLQIAFSADGGAMFACALDHSAPQACTSPWALSALAAGDHTVTIRATDTAGNVEADAATATFTVDPSPPAAASLTATPDADMPAGAARGAVEVTAAPGAGGVRVVVTEGAREVYSGAGGTTRDVVGDGADLTYQAVSYDAAGNASEPVTVSVRTPDRTPPAIPALTVAAGYPLRLHASVEPGATVTVSRSGASLVADAAGDVRDDAASDAAAPAAPAGVGISMSTPTSLSVAWSAASDAGTTYAYRARATDEAGNASPSSAEVSALALAGVASYRVLVDGAIALETAGTRATVSGLAPGSSHVVAVVAVDYEGNASAASDPVAATTGTVGGPHPPRVTLDVHPLVARPGATVRLHADAAPDAGPLATFTWTFDDGVTASGADVVHVFGSGGSHTVRSTVSDGSGGSATTPIVIYVDGVPPVIRLIGRNGHTLSFAGADAESGIDTIVADVAGRRSALDPARPVLTLPDGRTVVKLTITDRAGNTAVYTVPVTMDTTAPAIAVTAPRLGLAGTAAVAVAVTDATSGVARLALDGRALARAARTITVATGAPHRLVATDGAGNERELAFTVPRVTPIAALRGPELDGARHDSLFYGTRVQTGTRLVLLRGTALRLAALGLVPASAGSATRFTPALHAALQRFQAAHRLAKAGQPAYGTIGPRTKAALDAAAATATDTLRAG